LLREPELFRRITAQRLPVHRASSLSINPQATFHDRADAGRVLAGLLDHYRGWSGLLVLGLARGGVPVAFEVAVALDAWLDVFVVRKVGLPGRAEQAMGAIASGGVVVVNEDALWDSCITPEVFAHAVESERGELLRREQRYRCGRSLPAVAGRTVLLIDDGLATGASMRAAVRAVRRLHPIRVVVAVPTAPEPTCAELSALVEQLVCASTPSPFDSVGASFDDFSQTTDEQVCECLRAAASRPRPG